MTAKVWAVVVTYNRAELLDQCLAALTSQTRACDAILVIDNASSDGTAELLATRWRGKVLVHTMATNTGGAGGFHEGVRLAVEAGADEVWLMDDDVIPEPDALERLLAAGDGLKTRGADYGFVCSLVRTPEGACTNVPDVDMRPNAQAYPNWGLHLDLGVLAVRRSTFVSILVPARSVRAFGLPIKEMFIWGDDTEYTVRITQAWPGYLVASSVVTHIRAAAGALDITTEQNRTRQGWHALHIRNMLLVHRLHYGRRSARAYVLLQLRLSLRLALMGRLRLARIVMGGLISGLAFKPQILWPAGSEAL